MFQVTHTMFRGEVMIVYLAGDTHDVTYQVTGGNLKAALAALTDYRSSASAFRSLADFEAAMASVGATLLRVRDTDWPPAH